MLPDDFTRPSQKPKKNNADSNSKRLRRSARYCEAHNSGPKEAAIGGKTNASRVGLTRDGQRDRCWCMVNPPSAGNDDEDNMPNDDEEDNQTAIASPGQSEALFAVNARGGA
jgi:hypothetical protein